MRPACSGRHCGPFLALAGAVTLVLTGIISGSGHASAQLGANTQAIGAEYDTSGLYGTPRIMDEGPVQMEMLPVSGRPATVSETAGISRMLRQVQASTVTYRDPGAAQRAGYAEILHTGHWINPAYLPEQGRPFDLATPPVLIYLPIHGKLTLLGAMYALPRTATAQQLAATFPASLAGWHLHINSCLGDAGTLLPIHDRATCTAHGGHFVASTDWLVHVWFRAPNPRSVFSIALPSA